MNVPEYMPVLSAGAHETPKDGACVMEMVSFLAGEEWSDSPACTHPVLAEMARSVNDRLFDAERQKILPLMGRLFGTAPTGTDHERKVLSVRLAVWCARQVVDLAPTNAAEAAIETAEWWCDGKATTEECRAAAYAAAAAKAAAAAEAADATAAEAADATAAEAADATDAACAAAYACAAAKAAAAAADAADATDAAYAAYASSRSAYYADRDLLDLLSGLIDEYDRLTGRTKHRQVTDDDRRALAALTS